MKNLLYIILIILETLTSVRAQNLDDYLKIAAENNPALKSKFKDYEASLTKIDQVGSLPNPTLDFGYFISPIETRNGPQQAKIGLTQMFPWMGTLNAQQEVFVNLSKSKYEDFEAHKKQLFFQVKSIWYELYETEQSITITKSNLKILGSFQSLATQRFENGTNTGMVDVLRIQMEIAELENRLLLIQDQLMVKKVAFNNLLNQNTETPIHIPVEKEILFLMETKEKLNESIKTSNNELKSLNMKKEAFNSSIVVAQKQGLPMVGLGLNYFMIGESEMAGSNSGKDALMPMISVSIPIYRAKYKAQRNEAELNIESIASQVINKQNQLNNELEMNWAMYNDATRRVDLYNEQNIKAKQTLEIIISSYTNSGKDFEEILRIQRVMLNYDLQLIKAVKDKNVTVAKIISIN